MKNLVDSLRDNFCDCTCRVPVEIAAANHIVELEQQLTALREALKAACEYQQWRIDRLVEILLTNKCVTALDLKERTL